MILCAIKRNKMKGIEGLGYMVKKIMLPLLLIFLIASVIIYFAVPKTDVEIKSGHQYFIHYHPGIESRNFLFMAETINEELDGNEFLNRDIVTVKIEDVLSDEFIELEIHDMYSEIEHGDGPGDYQFIKDGENITLRFYTSQGFPLDYPLDFKE